jgi:DNA-binding transcriptional ArsR family regulator
LTRNLEVVKLDVVNDVFFALADPMRRLVLERLLAENGQTLRALGDGIAITRQGMAKHLAVLDAAGLVVAKRAGREKLHFIRTARLEAVADGWLARFRANAKAKPDAAPAVTGEPNPVVRRRKRIDDRPNHLSKAERLRRAKTRREVRELKRRLGLA